jgi:hypothetical protein
VVAKHKSGQYITDRENSTWFKIRNREYSQLAGREKLFERKRHREPVPGWHSCVLACAGLDEAIWGMNRYEELPLSCWQFTVGFFSGLRDNSSSREVRRHGPIHCTRDHIEHHIRRNPYRMPFSPCGNLSLLARVGISDRVPDQRASVRRLLSRQQT